MTDAIDADILAEVLTGLRQPQKALSPKFFYDAHGSDLFEQITRLEEYYPTRTEVGILKEHGPAIGQAIGPDAVIVEFGAGNLEKIRLLLDVLDRPKAYIPIDISEEHMTEAAAVLAKEYPDLRIEPVAGDYTKPLDLPVWAMAEGVHRVGFFPGSTIGNFPPDEARAFLQTAKNILGDGDLVIGVDLQKDAAVLNLAYNDLQGVTAAFNLNMLSNLNNLIGSNFDLSQFEHDAFYNEELGRIEMHLLSRVDQIVTVGGEGFAFAKGETIHTESSYKYTFAGVRKLAEAVGWDVKQTLCDERQWFSLNYFGAPEEDQDGFWVNAASEGNFTEKGVKVDVLSGLLRWVMNLRP
jgi:dimethylhistidine N-methyltransferase